MILFSAPGSTLSKKRAWLLTIPFDLPSSVRNPIVNISAGFRPILLPSQQGRRAIMASAGRARIIPVNPRDHNGD